MSTPEKSTTAGTACYVYGVVPADSDLPADMAGLGDPAGAVGLTSYRNVAAVISDVDPERPVGSRKDLLAHEHVLDAIAARHPVLPMRFGAVMTDIEAVSSELLATHYDEFAEALDQVSGHAQFMVRGVYDQEAILREVLAEEPRAMELRERLAGLSEDAGYYDRIRLGTLVSDALERKQEQDKDLLLDTLASTVASASVHEPVGDEGAFEVAFLVDQANRARFDELVEGLGKRWAGRIRIRLLGPLAPYDFVSSSTE